MNTGLILIILLLCCCIILLIGGFGFFIPKTPEGESTPTITLDDVTVEAEVEEESTTENYTYDELSKNIKLNIKWSNGSDFDDVTNVYFTRTHGDKTEKKETDANGRKSNTTGNKIQFVQKPGEDMRGEHTIKVTYKLKGQTQEKVMTTFKTNISDDQLTLAADSVSPVSVSYSPATVPFSTEVETQKTAATLNPNPSGFGALFFIPSGTNNAIKIKRVSDGKFLTHSATWGATGGVFYVQSSTGDKRRISTTTTDDGKLLTSVGPAMKKYTDMNPEERQKSLFTISFAVYTGPYSVRDAWTGANEWGEGNTIFLDRHTLDCGDDGLNEFKFVRPSTEQIEYSYKCLEGINSPADIVKDSGANDWGEGNAIFLDRHTVDCGTKPITKFRLGRPTPSEIRYDYTCNSKDVTGACRDVNTEWNDEGDGKSIYLDRHDVKCDAGEVITKFKLGRDGQGKYRYDYKCCKM
jgi:hypothetical protein